MSDDVTDDFFALVRHNTERYFLSLTRYSTNAFYRRQPGFVTAQLVLAR